jgi:hypothetical protein
VISVANNFGFGYPIVGNTTSKLQKVVNNAMILPKRDLSDNGDNGIKEAIYSSIPKFYTKEILIYLTRNRQKNPLIFTISFPSISSLTKEMIVTLKKSDVREFPKLFYPTPISGPKNVEALEVMLRIIVDTLLALKGIFNIA